jgi:hypothetical protein
MPVLLVMVLTFAVAASVQFLNAFPGAERGLVLFEKACPIHSAQPAGRST